MNLVEKHIVPYNELLHQICFNSARLYNFITYHKRQAFFKKQADFSEFEIMRLCAEYDQEDYRSLPAKSAQQVIKQVFQSWKGYYSSLKKWKKYPSSFNGKPCPPKYKKKDGLGVALFDGQQVRIKNGHAHFPKCVIEPIKTNTNNIKQVRIIPQASCFIIEIVYEKEITDLNLNKENVLSLDLGLSNLATSANNVGLRPFIINGNPMKSFNQWYNKKKAKFQSNLIGNRYNSRRIQSITQYRNCWIDDKLHKISRFVVNYCIKNNIGTIVIGKNPGWKNGINIGSKNNQNFTIMPLARLIDKIKYKSELLGIQLLLNEESYTSKCDALALEPVKKQETYKGRRIKRGLFISSTGHLVNADWNGACNIARKVIGDSFMKNLLDSRAGYAPYKINIL